MRKFIYVLTISVLFVGGCLSTNETYQAKYNFGDLDKIAIVAVNGQVVNDAAKNQIADSFAMEILNKGYAPIQLAQVESNLNKMQELGEIMDVPQDAYQIGKLLKVPAILVINVPYLDEEIFISAQLIDANNGTVMWMGRDSGEIVARNSKSNKKFNRDDYLMDPLLMPQAFAGNNQPQIVLSPGERPFNPGELQKIEGIISRICSTLPSVMTNNEESVFTAPIMQQRMQQRPRQQTTIDW